jgi:F-type H+-transporting ATPase subunit epsilon
MSHLTVQVVTPEATRFTGEAQRVQLPGVMGQMGVLPSHAPLVSMLQPGVVEVIARDGKKIFAVAEGFATIANDQVVCLVDDAVDVTQVDSAKVTAKIAELERTLTEDDNPRLRAQIAFLQAQLTLKG